jgi:hypothetical protein
LTGQNEAAGAAVAAALAALAVVEVRRKRRMLKQPWRMCYPIKKQAIEIPYL